MIKQWWSPLLDWLPDSCSAEQALLSISHWTHSSGVRRLLYCSSGCCLAIGDKSPSQQYFYGNEENKVHARKLEQISFLAGRDYVLLDHLSLLKSKQLCFFMIDEEVKVFVIDNRKPLFFSARQYYSYASTLSRSPSKTWYTFCSNKFRWSLV